MAQFQNLGQTFGLQSLAQSIDPNLLAALGERFAGNRDYVDAYGHPQYGIPSKDEQGSASWIASGAMHRMQQEIAQGIRNPDGSLKSQVVQTPVGDPAGRGDAWRIFGTPQNPSYMMQGQAPFPQKPPNVQQMTTLGGMLPQVQFAPRPAPQPIPQGQGSPQAPQADMMTQALLQAMMQTPQGPQGRSPYPGPVAFAQGSQGSVADTLQQLIQLDRYGKMTGDAHIPALIGTQEGIVNKEAMSHGGDRIVAQLNAMFPNNQAPATGPVNAFADGTPSYSDRIKQMFASPDSSDMSQVRSDTPDPALQALLYQAMQQQQQLPRQYIQKPDGTYVFDSPPLFSMQAASGPAGPYNPANQGQRDVMPTYGQGGGSTTPPAPPVQTGGKTPSPSPTIPPKNPPSAVAGQAAPPPSPAMGTITTQTDPQRGWSRTGPELDLSKVNMQDPGAYAQIYNAIMNMYPDSSMRAGWLQALQPMVSDAMQQEKLQQQINYQNASMENQNIRANAQWDYDQARAKAQEAADAERERHDQMMEKLSQERIDKGPKGASEIPMLKAYNDDMKKALSDAAAGFKARVGTGKDPKNLQNAVLAMLYSDPSLITSDPTQLYFSLKNANKGLFGGGVSKPSDIKKDDPILQAIIAAQNQALTDPQYQNYMRGNAAYNQAVQALLGAQAQAAPAQAQAAQAMPGQQGDPLMQKYFGGPATK